MTISPLDNRYKKYMGKLYKIFDEFYLTNLRLKLEIEWFKEIMKIRKISLNNQNLKFLNNITEKFKKIDFIQIKKIEQKTNHDIKAIEYFLKEKLTNDQYLCKYKEYVHLGCTSEDINNLSYALIMFNTRRLILLPLMKKIIKNLYNISSTHAHTCMIARTHGQPATPTTFGKEMSNFAYRLTRQYNYFLQTTIMGKFNGAVGNYNAISICFPNINWEKINKNFVEKFNLTWNPYTTQIEPHDWISEYCDILIRFNTILIGLCRDCWSYSSIGYIKQLTKIDEVGSSTMPHKINPITLENAEGNLGISNSLLHHFSIKLPISRWQRDLSDSTVMRNLGTAIGHSFLAYQLIERWLNEFTLDTKKMKAELNEHWEILSEAIQTILRISNINSPYEQLKNITRGNNINKQILHDYIKSLNIPVEIKQQLLQLTPENYMGYAPKLAILCRSRLKNLML